MTDPLNGRCAPACRLSRAISRIATGKNLLASFILWLVFETLIFSKPLGIAQLREITGGKTILDMTFTTGPEGVYVVLDALGEPGRAFDLTRIVPLDLVYPFTYALFLSVAISWLLARWLPGESRWKMLNLLPVLAAVADYCENAGIITLLLTYPARLDPVAAWVSTMYVIKFAFSAFSFIALFTALAGWAAVKVRRHHGRSPS